MGFRSAIQMPAEPVARRRAVLVVVGCGALTIGGLGLLLAWILSGDLQPETVAAAAILYLVLGGLAALALSGHETAALRLFALSLAILAAADVSAYSLHTSMAAGFMLPILLIARGFGLREGIAAAAACSAYTWLLAATETADWYPVPYATDISHLTFDAPALTVLYLLAGVLAGYATDSLPVPGNRLPPRTPEKTEVK